MTRDDLSHDINAHSSRVGYNPQSDGREAIILLLVMASALPVIGSGRMGGSPGNKVFDAPSIDRPDILPPRGRIKVGREEGI